MADNITETTIETGSSSTEINLNKELDQASEIGRLVLKTVDERTSRPNFQVRSYSMPMFSPDRFPRDAIRNLNLNVDRVSEDDIKAAQEASVALSIEAATQVVEARPTSSRISEDSESLVQVKRILRRSEGYIIQIKDSNLEIIIKGARGALERRATESGLENSKQWNDQHVMGWTEEVFKRADLRLGKTIQAIQDYH